MTRTHTVPAGTMASAFANAGITPDITHGTSYFDLLSTLDDVLVHALLRARVLSSMAWAIDTAAINVARSIFWDTHKEASEVGHIDNFADFLNKMSEMRANENYIEDLGFELGAGKLHSLTLLLKLSQKWHDVAQGAAMAANMKYAPKSFEVLLASEKAQAVDALTMSKLDALIDATFDGEEHTAEEVAQAKKLVAAQQAERMATMHASRQMISPAVLRIIAYADYRDESEACEFWQLPIELQARLVNNSISAIDRTLTDLASYRSITAIEYIGLIKETKGAKARLNDVLKTTKFMAH